MGTPEAALFYAVRTQDRAAVKRLLQRGARVAVQDRWGLTPLMYAAEYGYDTKTLDILLRYAPDRKAALELRDSKGETVLARSVQHVEAFPKILRAGADPNTTNSRGERLVTNCFPDQREMLLKAGAKLQKW